MKSTIALALASASTVAAHATFQQLWINGVDQDNSCVRMPVSFLSDTDMISPHAPRQGPVARYFPVLTPSPHPS